ncbi:SDR family oxidoreductase [Agrobacterium rhizogenes]|uniref:Phosphopantetheine attachment site family protein n=1 Tax=Rhizobium rhizogenes TaxID=359 RepID=A0A7S4ZTY2_RHIRH|nr:beta-ketoacyl reductase [Rhizobium rhizogenes]NTF59365.1 SDR family oxidoreductase [Rhizobium rhizogenes]NTF78950.1 SDR family oxidoreductase [Rhizobium rhizogenes]NTJ51591.1 SDR family oxidoreductase [Rhizobium rhizogenes]QCL10214.1 phosphopantetheine attachment site family protein [Rhizobium rhizogenes]
MTAARIKKNPSIAEWFYFPTWQRAIAQVYPTSAAEKPRLVLIKPIDAPQSLTYLIEDMERRCELIIASVSDEGRLVNAIVDHQKIEVSEFELLWKLLHRSGNSPHVIVHALSSIDHGYTRTVDSYEEQLDYLNAFKRASFFPLIEIVRSYANSHDTRQIKFVCLTNDTTQVESGDRSDPYRAMLQPCPKVVAQELPFITGKSIDYRESDVIENASTRQLVVTHLLQEFDKSVVAVRGNSLWLQSFEPISLDGTLIKPVRPSSEGAYLITGGRGRIGYTMAHYLAKTFGANLVLTGISNVIPREEWDSVLCDPLASAEDKEEVTKLRQLEQYGSQVRIVRCDATDLQATSALIFEIEREFGSLRGVVHAAGIFESQRAFRGILDTSLEDCERRLLPKVNGTLVLSHALKGRKLDFLYMQSSLSAILGGFGFLAYSSGNMFMDMFAEVNRNAELPWMSINWDGWVFRDNDDEAHIRSVVSPAFASPDFGVVAEIAIKPAEGQVCLDRLLKWGQASQILVSTASLDTRIEHWVDRSLLKNSTGENTTELREASELAQIIAIFQDLLGVNKVDPSSDFFALGGDSLTGIQLASKLSATLGRNFDIIRILEEPTPLAIFKQYGEFVREAQN